jgi:SpoVK/Ycf46/Vps4 family AAA+-type ATPase
MRKHKDLKEGELVYASLPNSPGYIIAEFVQSLSEDQTLIKYEHTNFYEKSKSVIFAALINSNVIINEHKVKDIREHFEIKEKINKLEEELTNLKEREYILLKNIS